MGKKTMYAGPTSVRPCSVVRVAGKEPHTDPGWACAHLGLVVPYSPENAPAVEAAPCTRARPISRQTRESCPRVPVAGSARVGSKRNPRSIVVRDLKKEFAISTVAYYIKSN